MHIILLGMYIIFHFLFLTTSGRASVIYYITNVCNNSISCVIILITLQGIVFIECDRDYTDTDYLHLTSNNL